MAKELINIWIFCNVYPLNETTVKQKNFALVKTLFSLSQELFSLSQEPNEQNKMEWPNLAMMSERYQLSDRASAAVANAALKDAGLIMDLDKTIDKNKL